MNIFNQSISFHKGAPQVSQPSGEVATQNTVQTLAEAIINIKELSVGQIFQGEIIDIRNAQVFIGLSDGQTIMAKLNNQVDLYIGQTLSFQIKSNNGNQIEIKPLTNNPMQNPTLLKALEAASLPVNEKNLKMVKYLMEAQMPIDKQSLHHINKQGSLYSEADIKSIVQMNKLQIPVTKKTLTQFENYKNYEHRIAMEIENISREVPDLLENLSRKEDIDKAIFFHKGIISILSDNHNLPVSELISNPEVKETAFLDNIKETTNLLNNAKETTDLINNSTEKTTNEFIDSSIIKIEEDIKADYLLPREESVNESFVATRKTESGIGRFLPLEAREVLIQKLKTIPLSKETLGEIRKGTISEAEFLEKITFALETKGDFLENEIKELFKSKEYHKILSEFVKESWLLKPEELLREDSVKEFYHNLDSQMTRMNQFMTQVNQESSSLTKFTTNVKDNVDFMKQLNQMFTYLQIPLKLKNQTVHSELFVYTNKKNLVRKDGTISALLHLDMESLGSVDVYVNLAGKNLNTKFYLENEKSVKIIEENIELLNSVLSKKGYQCSSSIMKREEKTNYMEEFMKIDANEGYMKRYTFDVRT